MRSPVTIRRRRFAFGLLAAVALAGAATAEQDALGTALRAEEQHLVQALRRMWPKWDTVTPLAAGEIPALLVAPVGVGDDEAELARLVARRFAAWADQAWPKPGSAKRVEPAPGLADGEAPLLADALGAKKRRGRELVGRIVQMRRARLARATPEAVAELYRRELRDGLALYTAHEALLAGQREGYVPAAELTALRQDFRYSAGPALRVLAAARVQDGCPPEISGFAFALLLDRDVPDWRGQIAAAKQPPDLLALLHRLPE